MKHSVAVQFESLDDLKQFVHIANLYPFPIDLVSDQYCVDAKSIMGIFSLPVGVPISCVLSSAEADAFLEAIAPFRVQVTD